MNALETFDAVVKNPHQYAKEWKEKTGKKVIGDFCSNVPEEIIYAAGILPVRILGGHEPPVLSEVHILDMFCPFCRDVLTQGLKGRYDYLDGIVHTHTCLHIRGCYDSWRIHIPLPYKYYMYMPHVTQARLAPQVFKGELELFKRSLEEWIGHEISQRALDEAIEVYNTNRRLMREIYELRKSDPPMISGAEAAAMVYASMKMDKKEHNRLLSQLLKEVPKRKEKIKPGLRAMTIGSVCDDIEFIRFVESLGVNIVVDDLCTGSRYFWTEVTPQEDRLAAIAARYLDRPACPVNDTLLPRRRLPHILGLAKDYDVKGAFLIQQKFCDPHCLDIPAIARFLRENGIPTYHLELDVTVSFAQLRTRIEAFVETLTLEFV